MIVDDGGALTLGRNEATAFAVWIANSQEGTVSKLDSRTGQTKEENPTFLKSGDAAIVKVQPSRPMVIENVKELPQLGRFAIRDMGSTIAAGMCIAIEPKQIIR